MNAYERLKVVGRGAHGTVYLCRRKRDKLLVIIKQIPVENMTVTQQQNTMGEVRVLEMVSHPNVIGYYDHFIEDRVLYIVMEYCPGGTLSDFLEQRKGSLLDEEEILWYFAQILLSMHHLHSKQILHRDLKCPNILLNPARRICKLSDFGISKILQTQSKASSVIGTSHYLSPEICNNKAYNVKSDVWSLGCVLYEMVTLKKAFDGESLNGIITRIVRGEYQPIPASSQVSPECRHLVARLLHLEAEARPTVPEILADPFVFRRALRVMTDLMSIAPKCQPVFPRPRLYSHDRQRSKDSTHQYPQSSNQNYFDRTTSNSSRFMSSSLPILEVINSCADASVIANDGLVAAKAAGNEGLPAMVILGASEDGHPIVDSVPQLGTLKSVDAASKGILYEDRRCFTWHYGQWTAGENSIVYDTVANGDGFAVYLSQGKVYTSGSCCYGCLGRSSDDLVAGRPQAVLTLNNTTVRQVAAGPHHVLALGEDGTLWSWGRGDGGRLGQGSKKSFQLPQLVPLPKSIQVHSIACSNDCSAFVTVSGELYCCGNNRNNKLGLSSTEMDVKSVSVFTKAHVPKLVSSVSTLAMGLSHTLAVLGWFESGDLITMGSNQVGQLGRELCASTSILDDDDDPLAHVLPKTTFGSVPISKVLAGDALSAALTSDGVLYVWGKAPFVRRPSANAAHQHQQQHVPKAVQVSSFLGGREGQVILADVWTSVLILVVAEG